MGNYKITLLTVQCWLQSTVWLDLLLRDFFLINKCGLIWAFKLAIHKLWFVDRLCFFADHFKHFLWNLQIKTLLVLEVSFSGKPWSFCLHFKLNSLLMLYSKSVKLYTIFWHVNSILATNLQWVAYSTPHTPSIGTTN